MKVHKYRIHITQSILVKWKKGMETSRRNKKRKKTKRKISIHSVELLCLFSVFIVSSHSLSDSIEAHSAALLITMKNADFIFTNRYSIKSMEMCKLCTNITIFNFIISIEKMAKLLIALLLSFSLSFAYTR